jgi:hypothetical protein
MSKRSEHMTERGGVVLIKSEREKGSSNKIRRKRVRMQYVFRHV